MGHTATKWLATAALGFTAAGACLGQTVLPEGTKVRLRLEQNLSSATAEEGRPVQLNVTDDVKVGDTVVIPQGATAVGMITQAVPKRRMGRTGKLDFSRSNASLPPTATRFPSATRSTRRKAAATPSVRASSRPARRWSSGPRRPCFS